VSTTEFPNLTDVPPAPGPKRVVVIGGGYAGFTAALELANARREGLRVTLIDREPGTLFRTELYDIARMADVDRSPAEWRVPFPETSLPRAGVLVLEAEVERLDLSRPSLVVRGEELRYDALVLAPGGVPEYYGIPGLRENSEQIYTYDGARALAARLRTLLAPGSACAATEPGPEIVVAGGGTTGVELATDLASADWEKTLGPGARRPRIVLLAGHGPFLSGLPEKLVARVRAELSALGIELVEGARVAAVEPGSARLDNGTTRRFDVLVWCGGLSAPPIVRNLPEPHGPGGRLRVTSFLEVYGRPGVFCIGDSAAILDPVDGSPVPSTAQAALEEAPVAARNALARMYGGRFEIFRYRPRGVAVSIGGGRAVAARGDTVVDGRAAGILDRLVEREYHAHVKEGIPAL
jgi:NADH dehydrogenase